MKTVFVVDGVVTGHGTVFSSGAVVTSGDPNATAYVVDTDSPVDVGWTCVVTDGQPVFTAPTAATYALLTPMQFYLAFATAERMKLKALATTGLPANSAFNSATTEILPDPIIEEFWATYQMAVQSNAHIDPNLPSIQEALEYLANPTAPTPQVITADRIPSILHGVAQ